MDRSEALFERAKKVLPGGVNSPVRAYRAVGLTPRFITRADGAYIWDEDGNKYIDYVCSWGPMILGHNHPIIREAVERAVKDGLSFGASTRREVEIAELMVRMVPNIEMVRMVNSGTEAVMSALRLARGATGRDKLMKFEGCYHGHSDSMLVKAGSSAVAEEGRPSSARGRSPASSWSRWRRTWAWSDRSPVSSKDCARSATRRARCSCLTRSSPGSVWRAAARRSFSACAPIS